MTWSPPYFLTFPPCKKHNLRKALLPLLPLAQPLRDPDFLWALNGVELSSSQEYYPENNDGILRGRGSCFWIPMFFEEQIKTPLPPWSQRLNIIMSLFFIFNYFSVSAQTPEWFPESATRRGVGDCDRISDSAHLCLNSAKPTTK